MCVHVPLHAWGLKTEEDIGSAGTEILAGCEKQPVFLPLSHLSQPPCTAFLPYAGDLDLGFHEGTHTSLPAEPSLQPHFYFKMGGLDM